MADLVDGDEDILDYLKDNQHLAIARALKK